jgi:hypothetical protein
MKQLFFITSFLLVSAFSFNLNAQANMKHIGNSGVGGDFSIQNNDGKMIPIGAQANTKGIPLLLENWVSGVVNLKNGTKFNDSALNYSLYEDKLYFKRDNQFFRVSGIISDFYLVTKGENNTDRLYHFISGYPASSITNENTFFQLLVDGGRYQLLKWQHKKIREVYNYGGINETEYVNQEAFYIYEKTAGIMRGFGNKKNLQQIKNTLSIDESTWKAYLKNHSASSKDEQAIIDFVGYLNTL